MAQNGQHHITPLKTFLKVYATLVFLTVFTVYTATQWHIGVLNTPLAMLIATVKVLIVMFWFMHLKYDTKLNKVTIFSAFFFLFVFFGFSALDVFTRYNMEDTSIAALEAKVETGKTTAPVETKPPQEVIKTPEEPGQGPAAH
ncbi:MAG: cytochrome C oxidase subunit IV family protein [Bdellovibrionota bacterium]